MKDDYLWDRSGEPDPEIARLESLLGRYRHDAPLRRPFPLFRYAAAAAVILAVVSVAVFFAVRFGWRSGEPWEILSVDGTPTIDGRVIDRDARFAVGEEIRTDARSRVTVRVARVGEVEVGPGSQVTLVATSSGRHRLRLEQGTLNARLWAPPFTFGVRTPAGLASDIGCVFSLRYDDGAGEVRVASGWVDFDGDLRSSLIPAGAVALLRDEHGPGTPFYDDASPAFVAALRAFDFEGDRAALQRVLAAARPRDAMSVLHLLEHSRASDRPLLFDALSKLAPPPPGVTREGILERDLRMLDSWRRSLGLGGVKRWWLQWRDALPR